MIPTPPPSEAFREYRRIAERAFADAAGSYAEEELPLFDTAQESEFAARCGGLAKQFLDLDRVPASEYGSREAAVSRGLFQALTNADVEVAVRLIADEVLFQGDFGDLEQDLLRAGLTPERLAELAAKTAPPEPEVSPASIEPNLDQHRYPDCYDQPTRTSYGPLID